MVNCVRHAKSTSKAQSLNKKRSRMDPFFFFVNNIMFLCPSCLDQKKETFTNSSESL